MDVNFDKIEQEKEMLAVLKASVVNEQEIESELLGLYENLEQLKKDKRNLSVSGHKTVVKVKVKIEPVEYLGDVDKL